MNAHHDIAVVGSGFAGSLLAMIARRLGHSVVLIEKGSHPRVVIGESSTPLANFLFEELCVRYDLPVLKPLAKWGSWQRAHPEIACGLKRGFTFHHHLLGGAPSFDPERRDQLLVAASPHNEIADMHWYRAEFDHFLMREARAARGRLLRSCRASGIRRGRRRDSIARRTRRRWRGISRAVCRRRHRPARVPSSRSASGRESHFPIIRLRRASTVIFPE